MNAGGRKMGKGKDEWREGVKKRAGEKERKRHEKYFKMKIKAAII